MKYVVVKGIKGCLAGSPFAADRFLGQQRVFADELPKRLGDRYEPVVQAYPWHPDVMRACGEGCLDLVGVCHADSPASAMAQFSEKPKATKKEASKQ